MSDHIVVDLEIYYKKILSLLSRALTVTCVMRPRTFIWAPFLGGTMICAVILSKPTAIQKNGEQDNR
jgi:hypothetical protein